ncbi:uncharacterized protein LOC144642015 [Oculina patagonica]
MMNKINILNMQQNIPRLQAHDDKKQHVNIKDLKLVRGSLRKLVQVRANFLARLKQTPLQIILKSSIEPVWIITMKGFSVFAVLSFMAVVLLTDITAAPYFEDKDIYSDFRGDEMNSLRSRLGLRDNDYRDIYDKTGRFEDFLESRREALISCRRCRMLKQAGAGGKCPPSC